MLDQIVYAVKATSTLPVQAALLAIKQWQGKETGISAMQRLGLSYEERPAGPLIWFHASTFGECAVALPVLFRCLLEYNEKVAVMLTTASVEAYNMLRTSLPGRVVVQMMPLDNAVCVSLFMRRWRPTVGIMVESPFSPHLVLLASAYQVKLALINAHIEPTDLLAWHAKRHLRSKLGCILEKFALIIPQSDVDVGRFRIFGATMKQMPGWCNELKYAALMGNSVWHLWKPADLAMLQLKEALAGRPTWLAANTVHGEEEVVGRLHVQLAPQLQAARQGKLVTVVVPQDPGRCAEVASLLVGEMNLKVALWSMQDHAAYPDMDILLVDDTRQLPMFYRICEVTLMGNSLIDGCTGHSLAQAAVAGTALLLGPYAGSSEHMAEELNNAAVMAAEDAAAAVRSTGQVMDDAGGDESPTSQSRPTTRDSHRPDVGTEDLHTTHAGANRLLMEGRRLSQRHSTGGRSSLSSLPNRLTSHLSHMNNIPYPLDSPRTVISEADSIVSEIAQHHVVVRHFFGSSQSGSGSAHMGTSAQNSPHAPIQASPSTPTSPAFAGALRIASQLTQRNSQFQPHHHHHQPHPLQAPLQARQGSSLTQNGSLPSSPMVRGRSEAPGPSPLAHWDRVFSAEEDAVPWSGTSTNSRPSTPSATLSRPSQQQPFAMAQSPRTSSASTAQPTSSPRWLPRPFSNQRTHSLQPSTSGFRPGRPGAELLPIPTPQQPRTTVSRDSPTTKDSSTQTDLSPFTHGASDTSSSLPLVMMAAMMGAMGGAHIAQVSAALTTNSITNHLASSRDPHHTRPVLTFVPALATLDQKPPSMAGLPNVPLQPAMHAQQNPFHLSHGGVAGSSRAAMVPRASSLAPSSPSLSAHSSTTSFLNDPQLDAQAQKLKLKLPYSTWTATTSSAAITPRLSAGPSQPRSAPAGQSVDLMAAIQAMGVTNPVQGPPSLSNLLPPVSFNSPHTKDAKVAWPSNPWSVDDNDYRHDLPKGPELSSRSAPLLNRESFEFDSNAGSPAYANQHQQQRPFSNGAALFTEASTSYRAGTSRLANMSSITNSPDSKNDLEPTSTSSTTTVPWAGPASSNIAPLPALTMRTPSPSHGAHNQHSAGSSRSSVGLYHSDPGSPSCSQPSSSTRSERFWNRSESGSPTNPAVRVSVAGWMGDFGFGPASASNASAAVRNSPTSAPATTRPLRLADIPQDAGPSIALILDAPHVVEPVIPSFPTPLVEEQHLLDASMPHNVHPTQNGPSSTAAVYVLDDELEGMVHREATLSPRPSVVESVSGPPDAACLGVPEDLSPSGSNAGSNGGSTSQRDGGRTHMPVSRDSSSRSVDTNSSLRNVRTPRAVEPEPPRAWSNTMPPVSPRGSLRTRTSIMPPASPRAAGSTSFECQGLSIAELQALAANPDPHGADDSAVPETPTSRMSVINGSVSPFANSVYDRPNPFAEGHSQDFSMYPGQQDAQSLSDQLMSRLAQQGWDAETDMDSQPVTPTSRLSAVNSVASPFATNLFDRPNPFARDGPRDSMGYPRSEDSMGSGSVGASTDHHRMVHNRTSSGGSASASSGSTLPWVPARRAGSAMLHAQAASNMRLRLAMTAAAHPAQMPARRSSSGTMPHPSMIRTTNPLTPLPEVDSPHYSSSTASPSKTLSQSPTPQAGGTSSTSTTSVSFCSSPANGFAPNLTDADGPETSSASMSGGPRALSRFFSQSAQRQQLFAAATAAMTAEQPDPLPPLLSHTSTGSKGINGHDSNTYEEPETPRFRPRPSQELKSHPSSNASSAWYHSTPQLLLSDQQGSEDTCTNSSESSSRPLPHSASMPGTMAALTINHDVRSPPHSPEGRTQPALPMHDLTGALPSPLKSTPAPLAPCLSARRTAYEVRSAAQRFASLATDEATAQSILASADATVQAITTTMSLSMADSTTSDPRSPSTLMMQPLSPRSPYRRLFDADGNGLTSTLSQGTSGVIPPSPSKSRPVNDIHDISTAATENDVGHAHTTNVDKALPDVSLQPPEPLFRYDSLGPQPFGADLLNCMSNAPCGGLDVGTSTAAFGSVAPALATHKTPRDSAGADSLLMALMDAGSSVASSDKVVGDVMHMPAHAERAQLLAATEKLVSALEAAAAAAVSSADSSSGASDKGDVPAMKSQQVQAALLELMGLLGLEGMSPRMASGMMGSAKSFGSADSGSWAPLDLLRNSSSMDSLREYSFRIQSLGVMAALDAAVTMAGLASVVGTTQAEEQDMPTWEKLTTRVSQASQTLTPIGTITTTGGMSASGSRSIDNGEGVDPSALAVFGGAVPGVLSGPPPPDTAPLVVPGANGPVLVAAPIALVTRLSTGLMDGSTSLPSSPAATSAANSMADILFSLPSLPQLRLPSSASSSTGVPTSARIAPSHPGGRPVVTPHPNLPSTAPAVSTHARHPALHDDLSPASGSTTINTVSPQVAPPSIPLARMHEADDMGTKVDSCGSLFAFAPPLPPVVTVDRPITPKASVERATSAPSALVSQRAVTSQGHVRGGHDAAVLGGVQQLPERPQQQGGVGEDAAEKATRSWTASLAPGHTQAPPVVPSSSATSAYSAVNPAVSLANKVAGAPTSAATSSSNPAAWTQGQQPQPPQQASQQQLQPQQVEAVQTAVDTLTQTSTQATDSRLPSHHNAPSTTSHVIASSHHFVLPATQLSRSTGPAVWQVGATSEMSGAILALLSDPLERRSRGYAAAQAAAKLASGLVHTVWHVLDDTVITPALHGYVQTHTPGAAGVSTHRT